MMLLLLACTDPCVEICDVAVDAWEECGDTDAAVCVDDPEAEGEECGGPTYQLRFGTPCTSGAEWGATCDRAYRAALEVCNPHWAEGALEACSEDLPAMQAAAGGECEGFKALTGG